MTTDAAEQLEPEQSPASTRQGGRPRGRFDPRIDWQAIEHEYVHGIAQDPTEPGTMAARHWPTYRELGAKFGCSYSLVHRKAQRYGWPQRRELTKKAYVKALDAAIAKSAALSTAEQVQYLDEYIRRFGENIREGRVRADVINDLDKAARLREFLLGNADSRTESNHVLSLDDMQGRFAERLAERRAAGEDHAAAALAGVIDEVPEVELREALVAPESQEGDGEGHEEGEEGDGEG